MAQKPDYQNRGEDVAGSPIFKKALGKAEGYLRKPLRIKQLLNDAYKRASEKKDVGQLAGEVWHSLQVLFRLIGAAASGKYHGIPTSTLLGATAVVLYFMSPIDAIPDFIPIIGLLDDAALLAWFMSSIKEEMDRFVSWERTTGASPDGHHTLEPKAIQAASATDKEDQPVLESTPAASPQAPTTDSTRVPSRGQNAGGTGGNVR